MKKENIFNCLTWMINELSKDYVYGKEKDEDLLKKYEVFYDALKKEIDISKLTEQEALKLRFRKFDDKHNVLLFPLWIVPIIPEGLKIYELDGKEFKYNKDKVDNDIRFGCVAYGLKFKNTNNTNNKTSEDDEKNDNENK